MADPQVSAIISTYQRPEIVPRAIRSVLAQTWRPLELVVVDDGSGDETQQILHDLEVEIRNAGVSCRFIEKRHQGLGAVRNTGFAAATGDYFALLDDDDTWMPQKLERQVSLMLKTPEAGVCFAQFVYNTAPDQPKPRPDRMKDGWVFESLCAGTTRPQIPTVMIRADVIEKTGGFAPINIFEDSYFYLRAALETPFIALQEPVATVYTPEGGTMSRAQGLEGDLKRDRATLRRLAEFEQERRDHPRFDPDALTQYRVRVFDEHIKHLLWMGRINDAGIAWQQAIKLCGDQPMLLKLKRKLRRARVAGWFGLKLKKPE